MNSAPVPPCPTPRVIAGVLRTGRSTSPRPSGPRSAASRSPERRGEDRGHRRRAAREVLIVDPTGYSLLTLHRPSNVDTEGALRPILQVIARIQAEHPVVFPVHPRTRGRLERLLATVPAMANLRLAAPLPYLDFVLLMTNARCVLTDSGGIQEETTALGVPCLTLRENTERPITVSRGTNRVIGADPDAIYTHWRRAADGEWPKGKLPELWDGQAAQRIVKILLRTR